MAKKVVYFSKIILKDGDTKKEINYKDLEDIHQSIFNQFAIEHDGIRSLDLRPFSGPGELKTYLDIISIEDHILTAQLSKGKEINGMQKRDFQTYKTEGVIEESKREKIGVEIITFLLLDYKKGICMHVSVQSAPNALSINDILSFYSKKFVTEVADIPNQKGIEVLYDGEDPEILQVEFDLMMPNPNYLTEVLGIESDEVREMIDTGVKSASIVLKPIKRGAITRDKNFVQKLIKIFSNGKDNFSKLRVDGKSKGKKRQSFDFHAKYYSYPINIKSTYQENGIKREYPAEEVKRQYISGLKQAYEDNKELLLALVDRD